MIKTFSCLDDVLLLDILSEDLDGDWGECLFAAVDHDVSKPIRIMPDLLAIIQQISADDLSCLIERVVYRIVDADLIGALGSVTFSLLRADAPVVHDHEIEMNLGGVILDRFEVFPRVVAVRFTGLSRQVVDKDLRRARLADHACSLAHEKIRQNARVKRAWSDRKSTRLNSSHTDI